MRVISIIFNYFQTKLDFKDFYGQKTFETYTPTGINLSIKFLLKNPFCGNFFIYVNLFILFQKVIILYPV